MEKRIYNNVMKFLESYNKESIIFEWHSYGGSGFDDIEWEYGWNSLGRITLPTSINNLIITIVSDNSESLFYDAYSELDSYRLKAIFVPKQKKVILSVEVEENQNEYSEHETNIGEDSDVVRIMKQNEYKKIVFRYNGGGDSGEIESVSVDNHDEGIYDWERDEDKLIIYEKAYNILESAFSGWEIDDGSSGSIYITDNGSVVIEHDWYTREFVESGLEKIITEEDFD